MPITRFSEHSLLLLSSFLVFFCSPGVSVLGQAQSQPSFKIQADFIRVPVTVLDRDGQAILDLDRENFELFDEGEPTPISNFVIDKSSVYVSLLLDSSGSVKDEIREIRDAAYGFVQIFDKEDRISIISFSDEIEVLQEWTDNERHLKRGLGRLERGYRTALYDALTAAVEGPLSQVNGRRVIILFTDGLDNESRATYDSVMDLLAEKDVILYVVSRSRLVQPDVKDSHRVDFLNRVLKNVLNEDEDFVDVYFREKEAAMNDLAETTGGRVLYPKVLADLGGAYVQIAREIKSQYLLTFLPPESSSKNFRTIRVRCLVPFDRIYYRSMYRYRD